MNKPEILFHRLLRLTQEEPNFVCGYFLDWPDKHGNPSPLTRKEWFEKARRIASTLQAQGIQAGDRVLLSIPSSPQFLISFLALWFLGAIPVPLPELSPLMKKLSFADRLFHVAKDCKPKGIVTLESSEKLLLKNKELVEKISSLPIWSYEGLWKREENVSHLIQVFEATDSDIAFIQYTSGSTGNPKGVIVTHGMLSSNIYAIGEASGLSPKDRIVLWIPLYHDLGLVGGLFCPLYWNFPFYLMSPYSFLAEPSRWLREISTHKATISIAPNFAYNLCARRIHPETIPNLDLSSLRLALNGAEPIDSETLQAFQSKFSLSGFSKKAFYPVYGMAEATLAISFPKPGSEFMVDTIDRKELMKTGRAIRKSKSTKEVSYIVSSGYPLPGHRVVIKEPLGEKMLSERELGEICFYGPSVMPRYFHEPTNNLSRKELRTGDLGYMAKGAIYIVDRIKDLIQIAGVNYYPTDIERYVQKIPGIKTGRVIAIGIQDSKIGTESLVIFAEVLRNTPLDEIKRQIQTVIMKEFKISPADIVLSEERIIPLTSSGKLMRQQCKVSYMQLKKVSEKKLELSA